MQLAHLLVVFVLSEFDVIRELREVRVVLNHRKSSVPTRLLLWLALFHLSRHFNTLTLFAKDFVEDIFIVEPVFLL